MQEDAQADVERADAIEEGYAARKDSVGPPKASLTRRSQSYSDFHDAATAVLGQRADVKERRQSQLEERKEIETELDFVDWYHDLEHDLLDASHDEYTLVVLQPPIESKPNPHIYIQGLSEATRTISIASRFLNLKYIVHSRSPSYTI